MLFSYTHFSSSTRVPFNHFLLYQNPKYFFAYSNSIHFPKPSKILTLIISPCFQIKYFTFCKALSSVLRSAPWVYGYHDYSQQMVSQNVMIKCMSMHFIDYTVIKLYRIITLVIYSGIILCP
jgi:hypothetical protein